MTMLEQYATRYENVRCERADGVLEVTLHTDGGALAFSEQVHHDLPLVFQDIANDPENKVVILTGTGDRFCTSFDPNGFSKILSEDPAAGRMRIRRDGVLGLKAFLDIEVPVIAAVNGPALVHAEIPMLADVVLASESSIFQDAMHFRIGVAPGDGVHIIWTHLLGANRGRYFLLTGQRIEACDALALGLVGEVLAPETVLPRARELARQWARLPRATLVSTRQVLTYEWKRLLNEHLHKGLTEQGLASALGPPAKANSAKAPLLEFLDR